MGGVYPYRKMEPITRAAPTVNWNESWKPKKKMDKTQVMMMAREQAKPFKMLSAYFTTTATKRPPEKLRKIECLIMIMRA